jgi:hypothetical protein
MEGLDFATRLDLAITLHLKLLVSRKEQIEPTADFCRFKISPHLFDLLSHRDPAFIILLIVAQSLQRRLCERDLLVKTIYL